MFCVYVRQANQEDHFRLRFNWNMTKTNDLYQFVSLFCCPYPIQCHSFPSVLEILVPGRQTNYVFSCNFSSKENRLTKAWIGRCRKQLRSKVPVSEVLMHDGKHEIPTHGRPQEGFYCPYLHILNRRFNIKTLSQAFLLLLRCSICYTVAYTSFLLLSNMYSFLTSLHNYGYT